MSSQLLVQEFGVDVETQTDVTFLLVAALLGARRMVEAAELLRRLEAITESRSDWRQWRARSEFLWAVYAEHTADVPGVLAHSEAATRLMRIAGDQPSVVPETQGCRLLQTVDTVASERLPLLAARAKIGLGDPHEAEAMLEARYGSLGAAEASQPALMARVACGQGRLSDAFRLAGAALHTAERNCVRTEFESLEARVVLAEVFFERNALDAARAELQAALRWSCLTEAAPWIWIVKANLARLSVAQQRAGDAAPFIEELRQIGESGPLPQPVIRVLNQVEVDCRLQLGDVEGAVRFVRNGRPGDFDCETVAGVELSSGRPDRVIAQLSAGRAPNLATHIRRLVLFACAEEQQGRTDKAIDSVRRAIDAAQPEHYVRPFLEHATQILPLLGNILASSPNRYLSELTNQTQQIAAKTGICRQGRVLEPLTERERQVLQYLPSHRTVRQIAKLMLVSANTVKTHQKNVYRKTGATSRDEAVTIARSYGLI